MSDWHATAEMKNAAHEVVAVVASTKRRRRRKRRQDETKSLFIFVHVDSLILNKSPHDLRATVLSGPDVHTVAHSIVLPSSLLP